MDKSQTQVKSFKLLLNGVPGTGKTTFLKKHSAGEFLKEHKPTHDDKAHPIDFFTNMGNVRFNCWEDGWEGTDYSNSDCGIIMFDVTNMRSYEHVEEMYDQLIKVCPGIPVVVVGNQVDLTDRQVKASDMTFLRKNNLQYYDVSSKSNYNFEKPFLYLSRKLIGDANLVFLDNHLD